MERMVHGTRDIKKKKDGERESEQEGEDLREGGRAEGQRSQR